MHVPTPRLAESPALVDSFMTSGCGPVRVLLEEAMTVERLRTTVWVMERIVFIGSVEGDCCWWGDRVDEGV
jgi:hypothetical protein